MTRHKRPSNRVRELRLTAGITQAQLAERAGISRTAVTSIEGNRLVPSVESALAISHVLQTSVEHLFGRQLTSESQIWAAPRPTDRSPFWQAEVLGRTICYPATSAPILSLLPDVHSMTAATTASSPAETLVLAGCDPAAGLLASQYAAATGLRLIIIERSSRQAVEMVRQGLVHLAGLHLSTRDEPHKNLDIAGEMLGPGIQMIRLAQWQSGVVSKPSSHLKSARSMAKSNLMWVGREPGSGARQCLERLLGKRFQPKFTARNHRQVVDAVASDWAEAGVCVQLTGVEAGLNFFSVQQESFDVVFPQAIAEDRRIKAFINVVRSLTYRNLIATLPGYDASETGTILNVP